MYFVTAVAGDSDSIALLDMLGISPIHVHNLTTHNPYLIPPSWLTSEQPVG